MSETNFKGSKRCMLATISSADFPNNINGIIQDTQAQISTHDHWVPIGFQNDKEAELKDFLADHFSAEMGKSILNWWLAITTSNARTPNWDLVSTSTIKGEKGILLVEAKAHAGELNGEEKGKPLDKKGSANTFLNHKKIEDAIDEANSNIQGMVPEINISRDKCYQLSNRIAHAWWLANQGIPVVLLYLGYNNARDMANYEVFKSDKDWQDCFLNHAAFVGAEKLLNRWVDCGKASFVTICRSLEDDFE